jgi:flagellar basal-body rod modification protein FlgD
MSSINVQDSLTQIKNINNQTQFEKGQKNLGKSDIGKDGFMQLMLAQLKYQNPLEPVDNTQQLAQQAQFTQIEELQKLNGNLSLSNNLTQAGQLVGKNVEYTDALGATKSGLVQSASLGKDSLGLSVDGQTISPDQITRILAAPASGN